MQTTTVTLGSLVDAALFELENPVERGRPVVIGSDALASTSDTTFTLTSGTLAASDVVQFGTELVLVTEKSADLVPIYTVSRGYYNTVAAVQAEDTVGYVNPQFPRRRIAEFINRSLTRIEAMGVPLVQSATFARETGLRQVVLPAETRQVLQVLYINPTSGRVLDVDGWFQYNNLPVTVSATGKMLMLPWYVMDADDLEIVYTEPYEWTGTFPSEAATVTLPSGAADLPAAYAVAMAVGGREISRQQLDRAEEWSQTEPLRGNGGGALVRAKWQDFYRSVDEAKRVTQHEVPVSRPLVKRPKVRI